jgi:hypothetical protein
MADATVIDRLRLRAVLLAEGLRNCHLPRASWSAPRASIIVNATSSPGVNQAKEISGPRIGQKQ